MRAQLKSLTRDTMVYGLGQTLGRLVTKVAMIPVLTRIFIPAQFGAWDLMTSLGAVLQIVFISGLDGALNRFLYEPQTDADRRRLVGTALLWRVGWSFLICVPASLLAAELARRLYGDATMARYLQLALLSVPCTLTVMFVSDFLRMSFRPWAFLLYTVSNSVIYAGLTFYLVAWGRHGVSGALGAQLLTDGAFAVVGLVLIRGSLTLGLDRARLKELLQVALPFLPISLSYWVIQYADRVFLQQAHGYHEVGLYGAAARVAMIMSFGVQAFTLAWGPFAFSQAQSANVRELFARVFGIYAWGAAVIAVLLSCFAREILGLGTTRAYVAGQATSPLLIFAALLNGTYYFFVIGITYVRRTGTMAIVLCVTASLTLFLNYLWARPYGLFGVGAATLLGYLATTLLLGSLAQRLFPCPYRLGRSAALLLLAGLFAGLGAAMPAWPLLQRLALKSALCAVFVGLSLPLGLVSIQDLRTALGMIGGRMRSFAPGRA